MGEAGGWRPTRLRLGPQARPTTNTLLARDNSLELDQNLNTKNYKSQVMFQLVLISFNSFDVMMVYGKVLQSMREVLVELLLFPKAHLNIN